MTGPIFLVGAERSGTTLLRLMLGHHPRVEWVEEFEYAVDQVGDDGRMPRMSEYYQWLASNRIFLQSGLTIDLSLDYRGLMNDFLRQRLDREGKGVIGAVVHRHFDRLLHVWPDARFIHILRDGRDVARSCIGMGWCGTVWGGAEGWIAAETTWERLAEQVPESRRIELRYERFLQDPTAELTRLCAFMGVAYDDRMLSYAENSTYERPDPALAFQWKKKMSPQDVRLVEARIGRLLVSRGYELSGLSPMPVNRAIMERLRRRDWMDRMKFRLKRYGAPLVALDILSRRLRLPLVRPMVSRRLIAIDTAHLR